MSLDTAHPSPATQPDATRFAPVQRVKFDRWLFDCDIDNVEAGRVLQVHAVTIGRWRRRFDDPGRRIPPRAKIAEIQNLSAGVVTPRDWYEPSLPDYAAIEAATAMEAGQ